MKEDLTIVTAAYYPGFVSDTVSGQAFGHRLRLQPWVRSRSLIVSGLLGMHQPALHEVDCLRVRVVYQCLMFQDDDVDERDELYAANINPIAQFPAEGIVIFGQDFTGNSISIDRINVRRLMVFLKKEISFIASRMLFDQNTQHGTDLLDKQSQFFERSVEIRSRRVRLILDESTTTPDLVDRNIIYAKILLKPTRTAEFFAIDFVITNTSTFAD